MKRLRGDLATTLVAICPASCAVAIWLLYFYFSSRPAIPRPDLGLIYPVNARGAHAYISSEEATGLMLLFLAFMAGLILTIVVAPKDFTFRPRDKPHWMPHVTFPAAIVVSQPRSRFVAIFFVSLVLWLAIMVFAGPSIMHLFVSHGMALH